MTASPDSVAQLVEVDGDTHHVAMDSNISTGSTPEMPAAEGIHGNRVLSVSVDSPATKDDEASSLKADSNGQDAGRTTIDIAIINSKDPMIMACPRCGAVAATKVTVGETDETAGESLGLCFNKLPGMSRKVKVYRHICSKCGVMIGTSSPGKRHALSVFMDVYVPWAFLIFWVVYSIVAFSIDFERAMPLFVIDMLALAVFLIKMFFKYCGAFIAKIGAFVTTFSQNKIAMRILAVLLIIAALVIVILCCKDDWGRLTALLGLATFIGGSWVFSWNRAAIIWRPVIWGFALQFVFGLLILRTQAGYHAFQWLGKAFGTLLDFTYEGSAFVFAYLADGNVADSSPWNGGNASVFAFSVLPTVIFFSSLVSVLYYLGVLQVVIYYLSMLMQYTLGTSSSESLNAAGNIFVGMTEAPLLIRPFLPTMTRSELHAVMTGGFATIAGGVLAIYISFGVDASHLLSASVMSAPAALAISKILYPEDEVSPTAQNEDKKGNKEAMEEMLSQIGKGDESNVIEAAANGAMVALRLAGNIAGMLIAFLALIGLLDYLFAFWGSLIDWDIDFTTLCGYIFYPIAWLMGIEVDDCLAAGELIGTKVVVNEFVAYLDLVNNDTLSSRSNIILIYALCGFSNLGSIGVTLGGLTPLAPERTKDLTQLVISAMIAGNLACFMTACIAALLYDPSRYE